MSLFGNNLQSKWVCKLDNQIGGNSNQPNGIFTNNQAQQGNNNQNQPQFGNSIFTNNQPQQGKLYFIF